MEQAIPFCTHLIYGYAGINPDTFKLVSLNEQLDINRDNFRTVTNLKRRFPGLRVLLSVGGGADQQKEKYLQLVNIVYTNTCTIYTLLK